MHELSIAQSIVDTVCERAGDRPVRSVMVRIGALTAVVPAAMHFCFELAAVGLEEPLEEVVGAAARAALEVDQGPVHGDLRQAG